MKYRILKLLQYFQKINVLLIKYKNVKGWVFFFISNLTQNRVLELNNGPFCAYPVFCINSCGYFKIACNLYDI